MKYTFLVLTAAVIFVSCSGEPKTEESTEITTEESATAPLDPNAKIDPVCQMVKDSTWTEYAVEGSDTTWFCSDVCKGAYAAHPDQYKKS
jgi:YHS domain-containing protein